ncbi:hypothetical protein SAMN05444320_11810 [Streptoalloteichus hindustanus]|uniref:Uncharacterized protein n=1 Tax=Streptoalloteichus hindustanus TaxID=2017 RepID=A0A1M5PCL9_STRHI|nr:hypothetical protein SAMN05444320_11810 [Streptoalloteichus hindustanus]
MYVVDLYHHALNSAGVFLGLGLGAGLVIFL